MVVNTILRVIIKIISIIPKRMIMINNYSKTKPKASNRIRIMSEPTGGECLILVALPTEI